MLCRTVCCRFILSLCSPCASFSSSSHPLPAGAGAFNALEVDQAVALVSTLVYTEKADGECKLRDELLSPLRQLQVRTRESFVV
jgi:hypothetical protein